MPRGRRALLGPDTAAEIERRQVERWREMDSHGRLAAAGRGSVAVAQLALAGTSQRVADRDGQLREYARVKLGRTLAAAAIRVAPEALASAASMDPLDVVLLVARVFETCGVRYVLGGSWPAP